MTIILPDGAEEEFLTAYFVLASLGGGHTFHLYTNDVTGGLTPDQVDALDVGDFTEATFAGYTSVTRSGGWTYTAGNPTVARNTDVTFTRSSTGTTEVVRGYYVIKVDDSSLAWFEAFPAPVNITDAADAITITPTFAVEDSGGNMIPVGLISPYGAATVPQGWLACDGAAVSRTTYADLFAVIGDTYGVGDGATTFNVPDLQQRFPLGQATSGTGATLGETGGAIDHVHALDGAGAAAAVRLSATTLAVDNVASDAWTDDRNATGLSTTGTANAQTNGAQLVGDTDVENPPYQVVTYIIRAG